MLIIWNSLKITAVFPCLDLNVHLKEDVIMVQVLHWIFGMLLFHAENTTESVN